jgi:hypothetical protein
MNSFEYILKSSKIAKLITGLCLVLRLLALSHVQIADCDSKILATLFRSHIIWKAITLQFLKVEQAYDAYLVECLSQSNIWFLKIRDRITIISELDKSSKEHLNDCSVEPIGRMLRITLSLRCVLCWMFVSIKHMVQENPRSDYDHIQIG